MDKDWPNNSILAMGNDTIEPSVHSGLLKHFERRKSRHSWSERWAVLGSESLRLFTNHESFLSASGEPKIIQLTADTFCDSVHVNGQNVQFKICAGDTFMFKCESESVRQEWLAKLEMVLSGFCRQNCFHCSGKYTQISVSSGNGSADRSRQNCADNLYIKPGEIIQDTLNSKRTNSQRNSTGCEDQITSKSPLKIYDTEQNVFSSFSKTKKTARTKSESDEITVNMNAVQGRLQSPSNVGQSVKSEKSPKNSFGYSFEADDMDRITTSPLTLFDAEHKRFSTFSKRFSLKRERVMTEFANPGFVLEDQNFPTDPQIPKTISKVYDAPLDYDVPALSKNDPKRGSLKVLTGKNNWKKYQAVVEGNALILTDPESSSPENNCTRIELKAKIKFTLLPRRNNDYRFKMSTGTLEYFFKTSNVMQRDSWIEVLTEASSTVCQMACPRCCKKASQNGPRVSANKASESDTSLPGVDQWDESTDEVFYVGMAKPDEGVTFVNSQTQESENVLYSACEGTTIEPGHREDQRPAPFRSGYLKTNAIDNNWEQYWATITAKQLVLHSSEENLNSLKTIKLAQNVQCKTAKRSSYDFRFTLVLSATECCEFKCATAHGRREWMTALECAAGGVSQGSNAGSKISEIVTKIRENQSKLEEIQHQQQLEKEREKQQKELEQQEQQKQQQQQPQIGDNTQDIYDDVSTNNTSQQRAEVIPVNQLTAVNNKQQQPLQNTKGSKDDKPITTKNNQQQPPQIVAESEDIYEIIPAEKIQQQIPAPPQHIPPPPQKGHQQQQQQNGAGPQDMYDDVSSNNTSQQNSSGTEVVAVHWGADEITPEDNNQQQPIQKTKDSKDNHKLTASLQKLLPPPPQHLPPLTPPQKRQQKQQQSQTASNGRSQSIPQQTFLPPPPQQLPPLTPPQKRHHLQQQQSINNAENICNDFVTGNIREQQLPPPPQQLPSTTPPQDRQRQQQLENAPEETKSNAEGVEQELYEFIPGDNGQQSTEELYEILPGEKNEPDQQQQQQQEPKQKDDQQNKQKKNKEKKNKRILPELHIKKQKKEKKKQVGNPELEQKDQKQSRKDDSKRQQEQRREQQQQQQQKVESKQDEETNKDNTRPIPEGSAEGQIESSWNFEEHVQVIDEGNSASRNINEVVQLKEENDVCVAVESKPEATSSKEETAVVDTSNMTQGKLF